MSFEEFQDGRNGCHLGYLNGTILAILNLRVTVMLPIKFLLNPTFGLGGILFEEFQDGGHLGYLKGTILAILNLYVAAMPPIKFRLNLTWFWRRYRSKNFKMAALASHLGFRIGTILAILNLCVTVMFPIKFLLNPIYALGDVI